MKRQMTKQFKLGLEILSMIGDKSASEGLKFFEDKLSEYENLHFFEAYNNNYNPTAIFFRRFDNNRPPLPAAYIYDFTTSKKNEDELKDLYKKLWNSCKVPFFIVFEKEEVKIFNLYDKSGKTSDINLTPYEVIRIASGASSEFEARNLLSGTLWESRKAVKEIKKNYGAYESFLFELKVIRKNIEEKSGLKPEIAKSLLIKFILIKYLEERKVFKDGYWNKFFKGSTEFLDTFKRNQLVIDVLEDLSSHFNGGIFRLDESEKEEIVKSDLTYFADFLKGRTKDGQYTLWRIYSFEDLPVELISNIYEDFLENKSGGVVYTPPLLVDFMIDEVMPLDKPQENFSVFDPACGSGIFLVAAYKRIIQWWMVQNDWKKPGVRVLKSLLKKSIFGTDINGEASQLAIFSLSLALCDILSPDVIWNELKFDDLSQGNILNRDLFEIIHKGEFKNKFDLIIGNPPFEPHLTKSAGIIEIEEKKNRGKLPDNQIALFFLEQSFKICKENGYVALVQPAGPLLYNQQAAGFRKKFLETVAVKEIIDFTCLRSSLFKGRANVATAVIVYKASPPDLDDILHIIVRENNASREKIYFELNKYDFNYVKYDDALNNKYIWKINLLGGGRIKHIVQRFSTMKTFGEFINEKVENADWAYQEGFIISSNAEIEELKKLDLLKENLNSAELKRREFLSNKYKAEYLTGKPTLPVDAFTEKGIDKDRVHQLEDKYFLRKRNKEVFSPPLILIKEVVGKKRLLIEYSDHFISFKNSIVGLHAPSSEEIILKDVFKRFKNNSIFLFYFAIKSGRYLINKSTSLLKTDIDILPFPEKEKELKLSEMEEIIVNDTLDYMVEYCQGKLNPAILQSANSKQLNEFGKVYTDLLNSVYKKFIPLKPIIAGQFICYPFSYGESSVFNFPENADVEKELIDLVHNKSRENILIKRNIRLYDDKLILLIKPRQLRYWMKSIAVRDADETFADLIEMGY